ARMTAQAVVSQGTEQYLFIVRDAPGFLSWLAEPEADDTIVLLAMRRDGADTSWRVCMKRFPPPHGLTEQNFDPKTVLSAGGHVPWLELVGDFEKVGARFYDGASQVWKEKWNDVRQRPALIELLLVSEQVKDARSATAVFWVPPVEGDAA